MKVFKLYDVLKHGLIYGVGGIAQSALGFILLPILTGKMSPNDFGVYSLILMSATIAGAIFYLGMTSAMPRSYFDCSQEVEQKSIFTTAFIILLLGAIVQVAIGYLCAPVITELVLQSTESRYVFATQWAFFGGALTFINQYFYSYLRIKRYSVSSIFFSVSTLIIGAMLTVWLLNIENEILIAPFKAVFFTQILMTIGVMLLYGKEMFTRHINLKECMPLLHFGFATILTSFSVIALDWADRIIIQRYMSFEEVGLYSAGNRVSGLIGVLLIMPFTQVWSPMMLEYQKNRDINEITSKVLSYFLIAGSICLATMALFSNEILYFLIKFKVTQNLTLVFLVLALASLINGTANIVVAGIFYERKVYLMPFIYAGIALIKAVLNIGFIPTYGISAAAFNALIASILIPCAIYYFSKSYFSFKIEWDRIGKLAVLALIPVGYSIVSQPNGRTIENFLSQLLLTIIVFIMTYRVCFYPAEKKQIVNGFKNIYMTLLKRD